jgi:hypothetical protein
MTDDESLLEPLLTSGESLLSAGLDPGRVLQPEVQELLCRGRARHLHVGCLHGQSRQDLRQ